MRQVLSHFSGSFALIAISVVSMPNPAKAQQSDTLSDFQNDSLLFKRDGVVSVQDRPQPEYDPVPYRSDGVELMPSISIDTIYDSNVFAAPDNQDDLILRVRPGLTASMRLSDFDISTAAAIDRRQYLGTNSQNTTDYALSLGSRFEINRSSQIFAGTTNGQKTEDRADPDFLFNLQQPVQYTYASAFLGGAHSFNRLRLAGRVAAETRDYRDGRDGAGMLVDQDYRNRLLLTADTAAEFSISPQTSVFVTASINKRDYGQQPSLTPSRDSNGYRLVAGTSFDLRKLVRAELAISSRISKTLVFAILAV
jgi:hypothetical protein